MSVDDVIEAVLTTVKDIGQLESTYFFSRQASHERIIKLESLESHALLL